MSYSTNILSGLFYLRILHIFVVFYLYASNVFRKKKLKTPVGSML